jgi:MFS transporter, DHA1 family, tetracycline resistance protein
MPVSTPMIRSTHSMTFIVGVMLIDAISFGITLPVTPALIMTVGDVDLAQAGRLAGYLFLVYACVQFFSSPVLGNLGDKYGRRPILLYSLLTLSVAYLVPVFATSLDWLFISRLIAGFASATYVSAYAYITDITPIEQRAQRFGLVGAAFGVGLIIGPVIGGVLGAWDTRAPFAVASVLCLVNFGYGLFVLKESLSKGERRDFKLKQANPIGAMLRIGKYPTMKGMTLAYFLFVIAPFALPSYWTFFVIEKFKWSELEIGLSQGFLGLTMVITQGFILRWALPILGPIKAIILGMAAALVSYLCFAFAEFGWQLYLIMVVAGLSGFVLPSLQLMMTGQVPADSQGELQGALSSLNSLASIIGPLMMTQLFFYFTNAEAVWHFPGISFLAIALLTGLALLFFVRTVRQHQPN